MSVFSRISAGLLIELFGAAVLPFACSPEDFACEGETSPCTILDEASCSTDSDGRCHWAPACEADCLSADSTTCQTSDKQKLCYLAYTKQCVPRDGNPCMALTQAGCRAMPGCRWANACNGSLPCSALSNEHECNRRLQCSWQPASR